MAKTKPTKEERQIAKAALKLPPIKIKNVEYAYVNHRGEVMLLKDPNSKKYFIFEDDKIKNLASKNLWL